MTALVRRLALATLMLVAIASLAACTPAKDTTKTASLPTDATLQKLRVSQSPESEVLFPPLQKSGVKGIEQVFGTATSTYEIYAENSTGSLALADGRTWLFDWGFDAAGARVVTDHVVTASAGQTATVDDTAFVTAIKDGTTTLDEANAYLKAASQRLKGSTLQVAPATSNVPKVSSRVWQFADGLGFVIVDMSELSVQEMKALGNEGLGPYQAVCWDASHFKAY